MTVAQEVKLLPQNMLQIDAAERANAILGLGALIEPFAKLRFLFLGQGFLPIAASSFAQPLKPFPIETFHPFLDRPP